MLPDDLRTFGSLTTSWSWGCSPGSFSLPVETPLTVPSNLPHYHSGYGTTHACAHDCHAVYVIHDFTVWYKQELQGQWSWFFNRRGKLPGSSLMTRRCLKDPEVRRSSATCNPFFLWAKVGFKAALYHPQTRCSESKGRWYGPASSYHWPYTDRRRYHLLIATDREQEWQRSFLQYFLSEGNCEWATNVILTVYMEELSTLEKMEGRGTSKDQKMAESMQSMGEAVNLRIRKYPFLRTMNTHGARKNWCPRVYGAEN